MRVTYGLPVPLSLSVAYVFRFRGVRSLAAWPQARPRRPRLLQHSTCAPYASGAQEANITRYAVRRHESRATRHLRCR